MLTTPQAAMYRGLAHGDDALLTSLFADGARSWEGLDERVSSLARLAVLIGIRADESAFQREVRQAIHAGATPDQITALLAAVARVAGSALLMSAAPKLALALGYDVDAGLEDLDAR